MHRFLSILSHIHPHVFFYMHARNDRLICVKDNKTAKLTLLCIFLTHLPPYMLVQYARCAFLQSYKNHTTQSADQGQATFNMCIPSAAHRFPCSEPTFLFRYWPCPQQLCSCIHETVSVSELRAKSQ